MKKRSAFAVGIALLAALVVTATAAATGTFSSAIYGNVPYDCHGATASGETHGTLTVTEHTGSPWVEASITIRGTLYPNRTYDVSVVQGTGSYCTTTDSDIVEFTTDSSGRAPIVHFTFYQHDGSTFGWIKIQHSSTSDVYRSQSVPLNK